MNTKQQRSTLADLNGYIWSIMTDNGMIIAIVPILLQRTGRRECTRCPNI